MKRSKIFSLAIAVCMTASVTMAANITSRPQISDGASTAELDTQAGTLKFTACGTAYWTRDEHDARWYMDHRERLQKSGYIFHFTDQSGVLYYACGWGSFEHLTGTYR